MVLLEGATIGLLGLLLALGTGTVLGVFWVEVQFPALLGWALDLHFPLWFVAGAAGLTLLLCILASILPSVRAGRLMVTAALRAE
jgi:ABC-type lipoprotein release transport system permease subunit